MLQICVSSLYYRKFENVNRRSKSFKMNIPLLLSDLILTNGTDSQMLYSLKGTRGNQEMKLTGRLMHVIYISIFPPMLFFPSFLCSFFTFSPALRSSVVVKAPPTVLGLLHIFCIHLLFSIV
jgi:hypothetical protein